MSTHPMQPVEFVGSVIRFKENKAVRWLLEQVPMALNTMATMNFSEEDRTQLAQLIGYSVSGFGDLSYVDPKIVSKADRLAAKLINGRK